MKKEDYILIILNCEKYHIKAQQQIDTWLKNINIPYFHVIGKEDLTVPYLFGEHKLFVKTPDDYNSLPKKSIAAFEAVHLEYEYKYIFKTDDDQRLIDNNFFNKLILHLNSSKDIHYGGRPLHITEHISQYYYVHNELPHNILLKTTTYCNGRFYLLSNTAVTNLLTKKSDIQNEYFEDYAIGYYLNSIYKLNMLNIDNDKIFVNN